MRMRIDARTISGLRILWLFIPLLFISLMLAPVKAADTSQILIKTDQQVTFKRIPTTEQTVSDVVQYSLLAQTAAVAATQAATSFSAFQNLNFLEYFKFFFSFFIARKAAKKEFWGLVYDAETSKPIPFAVLRIFNINTNKLVATTVSDIEGRYGIIVDPGEYFIKAEHQDFNFPITGVIGNMLGNDPNIYRGEKFQVTASTGVNYNIPMQAKEIKLGLNWSTIRLLWKKTGIARLSQNIYFIILFFVINCALMLVSFHVIYLILTVYYGIFMILHLVAYYSRYPRTWGTVYNSVDQSPVAKAFIKMYVKDSEKLMDTKISDNQGRFQFFAPNGDYTIFVQAAGLEFPSKKYANDPRVVNNKFSITIKNNALNLDMFMDPVAVKIEEGKLPPLSENKFAYSQV